jgi:hypothetical protein
VEQPQSSDQRLSISKVNSGRWIAAERRCCDTLGQIQLVAREQRRGGRRPRVTRGRGHDPLITDGRPSCIPTVSWGRRLLSHSPPRRSSATGKRGRSPEEKSRSSGSQENQHESDGHAQAQPAGEEPPSPPLPSFLKQKSGVPVGWLSSSIAENSRFWL